MIPFLHVIHAFVHATMPLLDVILHALMFLIVLPKGDPNA